MDEESLKGYNLVNALNSKNKRFNQILKIGITAGKVNYFGKEEWNLIKSIKCPDKSDYLESFYEVFQNGLNIRNSGRTILDFSYLFDDFDIITGDNCYLSNTYGYKIHEHTWLELDNKIYDTTLLLVIDISLKDLFGYVSINNYSSAELQTSKIYQVNKRFARGRLLKKR